MHHFNPVINMNIISDGTSQNCSPPDRMQSEKSDIISIIYNLSLIMKEHQENSNQEMSH